MVLSGDQTVMLLTSKATQELGLDLKVMYPLCAGKEFDFGNAIIGFDRIAYSFSAVKALGIEPDNQHSLSTK